jgi:hypothetical protein
LEALGELLGNSREAPHAVAAADDEDRGEVGLAAEAGADHGLEPGVARSRRPSGPPH